MLKFLVLVLLASTSVLCYDEKYDNVDIDGIIADDVKFLEYVDCLLDKGSCSEMYAEEYKKILPEIIQTACDKCTQKQKQFVRKTVKAIKEKKPELLDEFSKKFYTKSEHQEQFAAFLAATE